MECWKENCENKLEYVCQCSTPPVYSCDLHISGHLKISSKLSHKPIPLSIIPNPITKKALAGYLHMSLSKLYEFRRKIISDLSMQIKFLNEKIKITLNSFKEIIQSHCEMISLINSLEVISKLNNNKINRILTLEPEESIKRLQDFFDIFDESKFFINDEGKIIKKCIRDESNQFTVFRDCTMKIAKTDLNNYSSAEYNISLDNPQSQLSSMCLIPGNSIFCFGNQARFPNTAFIIDENNNVSQVMNAPASLLASGSIYYKNRVYIYGGWITMPTTSAFSYGLANKKWKNLNSLPAPSSFVSCICRKNKILLSGREHSKIYYYDIIQNNYTELQNVQANYNKILCGNKENYYLIEAGGNIYESNYEWKIWRVLWSSEIENGPVIGCRVLWHNKVYFALSNYNLYEFDFREKKIQKIKTI